MRKHNKSPAFQFYVNDWLSSTNIQLMTPAQEGAYIHLLCHMWNSPDCSITDNDDELAVLSRLGKGWFKGGSTNVLACFTKQGNRWTNMRLLSERKKQNDWSKKSRAGGMQSAKSRKAKALERKGGSPLVEQWLQPNGNSSSSSSSSSSEEENNTPIVPVGDLGDDVKSPPKHQAVDLKTQASATIPQEAATFNEFWKAYPKKSGKAIAWSKWKSMRLHRQHDAIMAGLAKHKTSVRWTRDDGRYIPDGSTFVNQRRWEDEPDNSGANGMGLTYLQRKERGLLTPEETHHG